MIDRKNKQNKVMLHIIMPQQVSGPNTAMRRIANSYLNEQYTFEFVTQNFHVNGKISFKLINDLRKQIKQFKPDIVHFSGMQASGFHAVVAAKAAGCKCILVTIRGFSGDAINLQKWKNFVFTKIIEPLTLKLCDQFYTVCKEAAHNTMVQNNHKKYLGTIHNAAPTINFDTEAQRTKYRNVFHCSPDDFLIAISGRMTYDKGISYISDAILKLNLDKIKFVFIGNGEYCDLLREKHKEEVASERVLVLGNQDNVLEILCACDLFLFATLHENLSNALLEAMAVGLPVVATNIGGNKEVVKDGENGFLIPACDADSIVRSIMKIYESEKLRKNFSYHSRLIIQQAFSQDILYEKIDHVYKDMLK